MERYNIYYRQYNIMARDYIPYIRVVYTDDIYHIGSKNAPCWLIKSTDGLILLDTGLPKTLYQIIDNIYKFKQQF